MISVGSCDTEDWSNDAENAAINYTLKQIHIENCCFHKFRDVLDDLRKIFYIVSSMAVSEIAPYTLIHYSLH